MAIISSLDKENVGKRGKAMNSLEDRDILNTIITFGFKEVVNIALAINSDNKRLSPSVSNELLAKSVRNETINLIGRSFSKIIYDVKTKKFINTSDRKEVEKYYKNLNS